MAKKPTAPAQTTHDVAAPAKAKAIDQAVAVPSRCNRCQSSSRSDYSDTQTTRCVTTVAGQPVTRIIRRRCQCLDCGQQRIDKSFEYHPEDERKAA